jgi:hypothetical protein
LAVVVVVVLMEPHQARGKQIIGAYLVVEQDFK